MAGLPDVDALASYGGVKANDFNVEDPTTDEDAAHRNLYAANTAAATHTLIRAYRRLVGNATTPTDPGSNVHDAVWGDSLAVKATIARTGTGVYTITWPTTVTDELGVVHTVNLVDGWANINGSVLYFAQVTITAPNVATVYVFNSSAAANDAVGVTIAVFVR